MKDPGKRYNAPGRRAARQKIGRPRVVGDVLSAFLEEHGLLRGIEDHRLLVGWSEIVGASLANETRPVRIERGTVWIGVNSASQANHLLYLKPWILRRIRELFPDTSIGDVRIQHRPLGGQGAR